MRQSGGAVESGASTVAARTLYAIEEEVFVTEPERPSLQSLYYLARLLWREPGYYWSHSASNFARGGDVRQGLMSGVEISTRPCSDIGELLDDLRRRRADLGAACQGLLVPVGHLFDYDTPTNICGLHIHIGPLPDTDRVYDNLAHFLPLLLAMTVNAPLARGQWVGTSYRLLRGYAIGPLVADRRYRFQDMIVSRRLGTIEIRAFDPVWDLTRLEVLLRCLEAIVAHPGHWPLDRAVYARLRDVVAHRGYGPELRPLWEELQGLLAVEESWFLDPPARQVVRLYQERGTVATYAALDYAYRHGTRLPRDPVPVALVPPPAWRRASRAAVGLAAYYAVKLPYNLKKVLSEW